MNELTPEEFLLHVNERNYIGKSSLRYARKAYAAYVTAHAINTFTDAWYAGRTGSQGVSSGAVLIAMKEKDAKITQLAEPSWAKHASYIAAK